MLEVAYASVAENISKIHFKCLFACTCPVEISLSFKTSNKNFRSHQQNMADLYATPSRSISSKPLLQFLEALLLWKAAQTPLLIGKHSETLRS